MRPAELWRRLRLALQRDHHTADLEDEMRTHLAYRADALRAAGASDDDARAAANRTFGNRPSLQEQSRDAWGFGWAEHVVQDLRHAARRLRQRPGFTFAVVGVMALGIGATTAMFSAVDAAMLRPLPFRSPEQLVTLRNVRPPFDPNGTGGARSEPPREVELTAAASLTGTFSSVAAYANGGLNLSDADRPARLKTGVVTSDFFVTLGVIPARGRAFSAEEGRPNATGTAIVSWVLWQGQFGGRSLDGWTLSLNGKPYTVVGVMPPGFGFPAESQLWIPMSVPVTLATFEPFRGTLPSTTIARVAPGVSLEAAGARLRALWEQVAAAAPKFTDRRFSSDDQVVQVRQLGAITPLQRQLVGDRRSALLVLLGATGLLLLIACANVTNLLLSHAAARRRELAVREVLGATRGRLIRQLLTESVFLSAAGAALALAVAPLALKLLQAMMPAQLAGVARTTLDFRVLGFATLLALVTGVGFGLWPAVGTTRASAGETIKSGGGHGATTRGAGRARRALVVAELALTLMLLVGAGLMLKSFQRLMGLDKGMDPERVATLEIAFPRDLRGSAVRLQRMEEMLARLAAVPGIEAAGVVNELPLHGPGGFGVNVTIPGAPPEREVQFARYLQASGGYFRALGIPMLKGRTFKASDDSLAPKVAVVNESMAKKYWGSSTDALGRVFHLGGDTTPMTVVGIVADVRDASLERASGLQMYFPVATTTPRAVALIARGTLPSAAMLARLAESVRAVDPSQAVYNVRMMDDVLSESVSPRRANTVLIAVFAALALALSAVGVYAVVANGVAQRKREFGIRAALGASGGELVQLIAGEMALVTAIGVTLGLAGAWALSKVLATMLFGVGAHDVATYVLVAVALVIPSAVATVLPARRALKVNPADVIRVD